MNARGQIVRISLPAEVAFDLGNLKKSLRSIAERLGCPKCMSGRDCLFSMERNFVIDLKSITAVARQPSLVASGDPDGSPGLTGNTVSATVPSSVAQSIDLYERAFVSVLDRLGCSACCSGFDILWRHERDLLINPKGGVQGPGGF
jgi:hypothetical protein